MKFLKANVIALLLGLAIAVAISSILYAMSDKPLALTLSPLLLKIPFQALVMANMILLSAKLEQKFWKELHWTVLFNYVFTIPATFLAGLLTGFLNPPADSTIKEVLIQAWEDVPSIFYANWIALSVLSIIYFISLHNKIRLQISDDKVKVLKRISTKAELEAMKNKISHHFLFNSLNSISAQLYEDSEKAGKMAENLAILYDYAAKGQQAFNTIAEEVKLVEAYLDVERIRFGEDLVFEKDIDSAVIDLEVPVFILQPLVENSIKNLLKINKGESLIRLKITRLNPGLHIQLFDSGEDFPKEINCGFGLQSVFNKLDFYYPSHYALTFRNEPQKHIDIQILQYYPVNIIEGVDATFN